MQRIWSKSVVDTICIDIYVGMREGYDGNQHKLEELEDVLQKICDQGFCVSVIPCSYIYKGGREKGAIVRLINYPRFQSDLKILKRRAIEIAKELGRYFSQYRISVQAPDMTYMISITEPEREGL